MSEQCSPNIERIITSGSSYEMGYQHGEKAKSKVINSLEAYERMFAEFAEITWKEAREKALLHLHAIERFNMNYVKEIEGLAKGAGVEPEDILTLNARSEIMLSRAVDGCTAIALTPPKTTKTWVAQNWDWKGTQLDSIVQLDIEQKERPSIEMVTEAGIIGKIGMNDAGIGLCLNALMTNIWKSQVPIHLGLRAILDSYSVEEALEKVGCNQMASAAHFLIASKTEDIVSVEVSPVYTATKEPTFGVLAHTNHICDVEMKKGIKEDILPDSFPRLTTVTEIMMEINKKDIDKQDIMEILSNHDYYPNSICRHSSPVQEGLADMETVFSVVMNVTDGDMSWVIGKPCVYTSKEF